MLFMDAFKVRLKGTDLAIHIEDIETLLDHYNPPVEITKLWCLDQQGRWVEYRSQTESAAFYRKDSAVPKYFNRALDAGRDALRKEEAQKEQEREKAAEVARHKSIAQDLWKEAQ